MSQAETSSHFANPASTSTSFSNLATSVLTKTPSAIVSLINKTRVPQPGYPLMINQTNKLASQSITEQTQRSYRFSIFPQRIINTLNSPFLSTHSTDLADNKVLLKTAELLRCNPQNRVSLSIRNEHSNTEVQDPYCGLKNFGNACYINSALQCVSHIELLTTILLKLQDDLENVKPLTAAYMKLLKEMWLTDELVTSAKEVRDCVCDLSSRFSDGSQQDCHEFLSLFLDGLYEELVSFGKVKESYFDKNFIHGEIKSIVKCQCGEVVTTNDYIASLPLPVPLSPGKECGFDNYTGVPGAIGSLFSGLVNSVTPNKDLHACFKLLLQEEEIGENGQWFCEKCKHLTSAKKTIELWSLPKVLILQLKRFTYDLFNDNKIDTFIDYPIDLLDLSDYVSNTDYDKSTRYDLVAVSAHTGSLANGHYIAFGKNFRSKQWYKFDDQYVSKASATDIVTRNAYILVYVQHSSHTFTNETSFNGNDFNHLST